MIPRNIVRPILLIVGSLCAVGYRSSASDRLEADSLPAAVAERARWIEEARQKRPDIFARVKPYYTGVVHVIPAVVQREYVTLKPFTLDLLHPKYQAAVNVHLEIYGAIKAAYERASQRADAEQKQRPGFPALSNIWKEYEVELRRIADDSRLPDDGTLRLLVGAVNPSGIEQLDPATLPAWEAGILDPDVTWTMKGLLVDVVASFEDPRSTPILGWFGCEATRRATEVCPEGNARTKDGYAIKASAECEGIRGAAAHVGTAFAERPRKDIALELAAMLRDIGPHDSLGAWSEILNNNPEWLKLLGELERDSETAKRLEPLLGLVRGEQGKKRDRE